MGPIWGHRSLSDQRHRPVLHPRAPPDSELGRVARVNRLGAGRSQVQILSPRSKESAANASYFALAEGCYRWLWGPILSETSRPLNNAHEQVGAVWRMAGPFAAGVIGVDGERRRVS